MGETCACELVHTKIVDFRDKIDYIFFADCSSLVTEDDGIESFDGGGDGAEEEDESGGLEIVDSFSIILEEYDLVIEDEVVELELVGKIQQLQQLLMNEEDSRLSFLLEDFLYLQANRLLEDKGQLRHNYLRLQIPTNPQLRRASINLSKLFLKFKEQAASELQSFMNFLGGIIGGRNVQNRPPGAQQQPMMPRVTFFRELRVYPASFAFREDIEKGDKILLPSSALGELYHLMNSRNKDPMVFCLKNGSKMTYCGVLEFVSEEGLCYIPNWMFKMLKFPEPGAPGTVALVTDMKKKYGHVRHMIKLQPHQTKFIDMENPKAILEYQLRNFTCLHEGDTISIQVFKDKFEIDILQITPKNQYGAICIIDADVDVDFAPPLDYVEPERAPVKGDLKTEETKKGGVFGGAGVRIDEKAQTNNRKGSTVPAVNEEEEYDPRKHRIHRGVRKTSVEWTGNGVKISDPVGVKARK